jgi:hypothetical protein
MESNKEFHTVYETVNVLNGKNYFGKHSTNNINDSYKGSGTALIAAIKKYKKENFTKEILFVYDTEEEAYAKEAELVTEEFVKLRTNYNLDTGGDGGKKRSEETKKLISDKASTHSEKKRRSEAISGDKNPNWGGKLVTEEYRAKMSKAIKGNNMGEKHWTADPEKSAKAYIPEYRARLTQALLDRNHHHSDEHKSYISNKFKGGGNPMAGVISPTIKVTIDGETKRACDWRKSLSLKTMKDLMAYLETLVKKEKCIYAKNID